MERTLGKLLAAALCVAAPCRGDGGKSIDAIVARNLFCSTCRSHGPARSGLTLQLISTMVVPSDERWSVALILDTATRNTALYARGAPLPGGARIVRIVEKRVYLARGGRIEQLLLDGDAAKPSVAAPTFAIDRRQLDQLLADPVALAGLARAIPSPHGFKLYAIRPDSIAARLGLENGDTVRSIDGLEVNTLDQAMAAYVRLRRANRVTVAVERRGREVTLDYTIE
jgi:general secretion pathway protein C